MTFLTRTTCVAAADSTPPLVKRRKEKESGRAPGTGPCPDGDEGRGLSRREAVALGVEKKRAALVYTSLQAVAPAPAPAAEAEAGAGVGADVGRGLGAGVGNREGARVGAATPALPHCPSEQGDTAPTTAAHVLVVVVVVVVAEPAPPKAAFTEVVDCCHVSVPLLGRERSSTDTACVADTAGRYAGATLQPRARAVGVPCRAVAAVPEAG